MLVGRPCDAVTRTLHVAADPRAASQGRRLVAALLTEHDRPDWVDAAELAVSELVTNAALHARTDIEVVAVLGPRELRVEVRDRSRVVPQQRHYGAAATTGRGMALVGSVTSSCGITRLPDGKSAWFTLSDDAPEPSLDDLLAAFDDERWEVGDAPAAPVAPAERARGQEVVLQGIPPTLWLAAREHHDALLRELDLYRASHPELVVDMAGVALARRLLSNPVMSRVSDVERGAVAGAPALRDVVPPIDVFLELHPEAGPAAAALQDVLDTAERLAAEGALLAFEGQEEIVAVRDWLCEQVQSQLHGVPARPFPGAADQRFESAPRPAETLSARAAAVVADVREHVRGVVAADERKRILAVSAPLARALGWDAEDLTGRRVVSLIPPALREAHIAGFSRHLSTGDAHIVGVPLRIPVLHATGSQTLCDFVLERAPVGSGRSLFLAWIEPVDERPSGGRPVS